MASIVENPLSEVVSTPTRSRQPYTAEDIEKLMDARVEMLESRVAELEAQLTQAAPSVETVKAVVAHLTEAPTNWHQSSVYFATLPPSHEDAGSSSCVMLGGVMMVLGQCMALIAVYVGTFIPSCKTSDQCARGTFCWLVRTDRCEPCGQGHPLPVQTDPATGGTLNDPDMANFAGWNTTAVAEICSNPIDVIEINNAGVEDLYPRAAVASWCEACVHPIDMTVDPMTHPGIVAANVEAMAPYDWVALLFATFVVALAVVGELKDIELVMLAAQHAGEKLSPRWRLALAVLSGVRRWVFLPTLVMTVPMMVAMKSGDALSVCFNTVALLFLCDIDNFTYKVLLSERVRTRVEKNARVELGDAEALALARSKVVHAALIFTTVPLSLWAAKTQLPLLLFLPRLPFWVAGVVEVATGPNEGAQRTAVGKGVARVTGSFLLGFGLFGGLFGSVFVMGFLSRNF